MYVFPTVSIFYIPFWEHNESKALNRLSSRWTIFSFSLLTILSNPQISQKSMDTSPWFSDTSNYPALIYNYIYIYQYDPLWILVIEFLKHHLFAKFLVSFDYLIRILTSPYKLAIILHNIEYSIFNYCYDYERSKSNNIFIE